MYIRLYDVKLSQIFMLFVLLNKPPYTSDSPRRIQYIVFFNFITSWGSSYIAFYLKTNTEEFSIMGC